MSDWDASKLYEYADISSYTDFEGLKLLNGKFKYIGDTLFHVDLSWSLKLQWTFFPNLFNFLVKVACPFFNLYRNIIIRNTTFFVN